jgi:hypothetical protein
LATTADYQQACATGLAHAVASWVEVLLNNVSVDVGDGTRSAPCYFSSDGGATALASGSLSLGALLYWVGSIAGVQLATSDRLSFIYVA